MRMYEHTYLPTYLLFILHEGCLMSQRIDDLSLWGISLCRPDTGMFTEVPQLKVILSNPLIRGCFG